MKPPAWHGTTCICCMNTPQFTGSLTAAARECIALVSLQPTPKQKALLHCASIDNMETWQGKHPVRHILQARHNRSLQNTLPSLFISSGLIWRGEVCSLFSSRSSFVFCCRCCFIHIPTPTPFLLPKRLVLTVLASPAETLPSSSSSSC